MEDKSAAEMVLGSGEVGNLLATDFYQLTMAYAYKQTDKADNRVVFEYFVRSMPKKRSYLVVAGVREVLDYIKSLKITSQGHDFIYDMPQWPKNGSDSFHRILDGVKKAVEELNVYAALDGTVVFNNEPILRVEGPLWLAQILESPILHIMNTMITKATKAARIVTAARGRPVSEFGFRRGSDYGTIRAAMIGGFSSTSRVDVGDFYDIPVVGTMAHAWVMAHDTELEAFQNWKETYKHCPQQYVALVDTYDVRRGILNAIEVFGEELTGIRIDSSPLVKNTRMARDLLDQAGLKETKIVITNDLDEYTLTHMLDEGAVFDLAGVGTSIATSKDSPSLGGVYKITQIEDQHGNLKYCAKKSKNKATYPGRRQIYRFTDRGGSFVKDVVGLHGNEVKFANRSTPILQQVMEDGKINLDLISLDLKNDMLISADRCKDQLEHLPTDFHRFYWSEEGPTYPVEMSENLEELLKNADLF